MELLVKKSFFRYFTEIAESDYLNKKYKEMKYPFFYDDGESTIIRHDVEKELVITSRYDTAKKKTIVTEESYQDILKKEIKYKTSELIARLKNALNQCKTSESFKYQIDIGEKLLDEIQDKFLLGKFSEISRQLMPDIEAAIESVKTALKEERSTYDLHGKPSEKQQPGLIDSSWASSRPAKIKKLYTALTDIFISDKDDRSQVFIDFLTGKALPLKDDRIKWNNQRALKYLIKQMESLEITSPPHEKGNQAFKFPRKKWELVKSFFVQEDGSEFDYISTENKPVSKEHQRAINRILDKLDL